MAKASPIQSSFNSGEWAPELSGRVDIAKYGNACSRMENFIPLLQGPARRRGGTRFVQEVRDQADRTWLARFEFNTQQAYVLEFGDKYIRLYTDNGAVTEAPQSISTISNASPGVLTYTYISTAPANGDWYYVTGVEGMTEINGRLVVVSNVDTTAQTFELRDTQGNAYDTTAWGTYTTGGTMARIYTIAAPWVAEHLISADGSFALSIAQSGDVLYICHPDYAPTKLIRSGATTWSHNYLTVDGGPFDGVDPDNVFQVYATSSTGAGVTLYADAPIFSETDIGRLFYLESKKANALSKWEVNKSVVLGDVRRYDGKTYVCTDAGTTGTIPPTHTVGAEYDGSDPTVAAQWEYQDPGYGWVTITGYTNAQEVTCTVRSRVPDQCVGVLNPTTRWAFGSWGSVPGFPSHVTFFRDRLTFVRALDRQIWCSVAGDYENFADRDDGGDVTADMAVTATVESDQSNQVQWIAVSDVLLIGTAEGEHVCREMTTNEPFGPGNVKISRSSSFGSRAIAPARVGTSMLFVQRSGRRVREMIYDALQDNFVSADVSIWAPHLVPKGMQIEQLAYQKEPHSIVWAVRSDGLLIALTFNKEHEIVGWHRHPIGGNGIVESVVCVPSPNNDRDDLWMIVRRAINGRSVRYIEYMAAEWESGDEQADAFYVDCGLSYTGSSRTTLGGLWHLEGETVSILANGATHPARTVSDGAVTLARAATTVHIGLACPAKLATMRLNAGATDGTAQGKTKRITNAVFRLMDTLGGRVGPSEETNDPLLFRSGAIAMNAPPPIFTGDKRVAWPSGYDEDAYMWYINDAPLPATVCAIMPQVVTQD